MCGRFFLISQARELEAAFRLEKAPRIEPRYNIAPTQDIPVVRRNPENQQFRILSQMRWGLIPSWTKDLSKMPTLINARCESVHQKPAFRSAFRKRHCAIPANGFFEWSKQGSSKQPHVIHLKQQRLFAFAGLWEAWQNLEGAIIESCVILTTEANEIVLPLHDRMPVILDLKDVDLWLESPSQDPREWQRLFRPLNGIDMECYEVSTWVNNPTNDDYHCIEPIKISDKTRL